MISWHTLLAPESVLQSRSRGLSARSAIITFASRSALITIDALVFQVTISAGGRSICVDAERIESISTRDPLTRLKGLIIVLTEPTEHIVVAAAGFAERRQLRMVGSAMQAAATEARLMVALDRIMQSRYGAVIVGDARATFRTEERRPARQPSSAPEALNVGKRLQ